MGVGGGGQVGQGVQPVEESGASGQWWRQQHPSYHHHHHHQHHHHYHHQAGYYTSQSHTHNNPVTTMKQSYMQVGHLVLSRMPFLSFRVIIEPRVPVIRTLDPRFVFLATYVASYGILPVHSSLFRFLVAANMGIS